MTDEDRRISLTRKVLAEMIYGQLLEVNKRVRGLGSRFPHHGGTATGDAVCRGGD
jgi:hypothetical protein